MSALSHVYCDRARCGGLSFCRQMFAALAVSAVAGLAIFATADGSLMAGAAAAPPAVKSPPPGWIDMAFADVHAASTRAAAHPQQAQTTQTQNTQKRDARKQDPCADFVYYFLNKKCSAKRVGLVRRVGFVHHAGTAPTLPGPNKQDTARNSNRVTFMSTSTTATD